MNACDSGTAFPSASLGADDLARDGVGWEATAKKCQDQKSRTLSPDLDASLLEADEEVRSCQNDTHCATVRALLCSARGHARLAQRSEAQGEFER